MEEKIDKVRNQFAKDFDGWYELSIIYKFAEALKKELHRGN